MLDKLERNTNAMTERAERLADNTAGATFISTEVTELIKIAAYVTNIIEWLQRRHNKEEELLHDVRFKEMLGATRGRTEEEEQQAKDAAVAAMEHAQHEEENDATAEDKASGGGIAGSSIVSRISQAAWRLSKAAPGGVHTPSMQGAGQPRRHSMFKEYSGTAPQDIPPHIRVEVMRLGKVSENYTLKLNLLLVLTEGKSYLDVPLVSEWGMHMNGLLEDASVLGETLPGDMDSAQGGGKKEARVGNDVGYLKRLRERILRDSFCSPLSDATRELSFIETAVAAASSIRSGIRGQKTRSLLESARVVYTVRWALKHTRWALVQEALESVLPEGETLDLPRECETAPDALEEYIRNKVVRYHVVEEAQFELQCVHHLFLAHVFMHHQLTDALHQGCIGGSISRLDISKVTIAPILKVFTRLNKLHYNLVLSVADCKLVYSARLVAAIRLAFASGNHLNIAEVCRDIITDNLDDCVKDEVLLCARSAFLVSQLQHCIEGIEERKVVGPLGQVGVEGVLRAEWMLDGPIAGIRQSLGLCARTSELSPERLSIFHGEIQNIVDTAEGMEAVRRAVKAGLWQASEVAAFFLGGLLRCDPNVVQPTPDVPSLTRGSGSRSIRPPPPPPPPPPAAQKRMSVSTGTYGFRSLAFTRLARRCQLQVLGLLAQKEFTCRLSVMPSRSTANDVADLSSGDSDSLSSVALSLALAPDVMRVDSAVHGQATVVSALRGLPEELPEECAEELHAVSIELFDRVTQVYVKMVMHDLVSMRLDYLSSRVYEREVSGHTDGNDEEWDDMELHCDAAARIRRLYAVLYPAEFTFAAGYHPDPTEPGPQKNVETGRYACRLYPMSAASAQMLSTARLTVALDRAIRTHSLADLRAALHAISVQRHNTGVDPAISPLVEHAFMCIVRHQAIAMYSEAFGQPMCVFRGYIMSSKVVPEMAVDVDEEEGTPVATVAAGSNRGGRPTLGVGRGAGAGAGGGGGFKPDFSRLSELTAAPSTANDDSDEEGGMQAKTTTVGEDMDMANLFSAAARLVHEFNIDRADMTMRLLQQLTSEIGRMKRVVSAGIRSAIEASVQRGREQHRVGKKRLALLRERGGTAVAPIMPLLQTAVVQLHKDVQFAAEMLSTHHFSV